MHNKIIDVLDQLDSLSDDGFQPPRKSKIRYARKMVVPKLHRSQSEEQILGSLDHRLAQAALTREKQQIEHLTSQLSKKGALN
jgi:hypothetical protein